MDQDFGRYEVIEEVGRGAMGVVYKGRDPFIGRIVAIKALNRAILAQMDVGAEEYLERFRREAQVSGVLNHPNIVKVFDLGPDFMVMEFVEGQSLSAVIKGPHPPAAPRMLEIVAAVAGALDYAHRHGVVHRDIKPANIMVQSDGVVKVMDFGLARIGGSQLTAAGAVLGSASYMAPEVIMGRTADPRADIFSLGVTAYEALTGQRPFPGKSVSVIITKIIREPPRRIVEFGLPHEYDAIFERVLAKEADQRYQTALDFAQALLGHSPTSSAATRSAAGADAGGGSLVVLDAAELGAPPAEAAEAQPVDSTIVLDADEAEAALTEGMATPAAPPGLAPPPPVPPPAAAPLEDRTVAMPVRPEPRAAPSPPPPPAAAAPPPAVPPEASPFEARTVAMPVRPAPRPAPPAPLEPAPPVPPPVEPPPPPEAAASRGPWIAGAIVLLIVAMGVGVALTRRPAEPPPPVVKEGELVPLTADVTPPKYVSGQPVSVPAGAKNVKLPAVVLIEFVVDEKGATADLRIVQSGGQTLDEACRKAVVTWRYEPAKKADVRVKVQQSYQFNFKAN